MASLSDLSPSSKLPAPPSFTSDAPIIPTLNKPDMLESREYPLLAPSETAFGHPFLPPVTHAHPSASQYAHSMSHPFEQSPSVMANALEGVADSLPHQMHSLPKPFLPSSYFLSQLNPALRYRGLEKMMPQELSHGLAIGIPSMPYSQHAPRLDPFNMGLGYMTTPKLEPLEPSTDLDSRNNISLMSGLSSMGLGMKPRRHSDQPPNMNPLNYFVGNELRTPVCEWTQTDVLLWLDKIMLGNLRPVFQKHQISGDMLLTLAEDDLCNEMQIHSSLIRRKLLRELHALKGLAVDDHLDMESSLDDIDHDLAQCVLELNQVMHEEGLSQPKVAKALGIQSQGHLSELLRGKYKHSRNSSAQHWAKEIRSFLSLTPKERQDAIHIYAQSQNQKKRKSSKRTVWTKEQAMMLENFFRQKPSPSKPERQLLASQCGVDVGVINTYFQNKRRRSRQEQVPS